jgi:predicted transcriptional regulator
MKLAGKLDRSRTFVVAQAIEDFVAREAWQLAAIEAASAGTDRGEPPHPSAIADTSRP